MTCKDCLHYEVCKVFNRNIPEEYTSIEFQCEGFTDRSEWVHLPCKAGIEIYEICERRNKSKWKKTVVRRVIHGIEIGANGVLSARCGTTTTILLSQIDKTIFLTREEAEKALERMKENEKRNDKH